MALNVKMIKLINGEDLIADVTNDGGNFVKFKNPMRVIVMPTKTDPKTPTVGFAPWAEFYDEKEFTLDKSHVLVIASPVKEFVNQYNSIFGGIVTPQSKLIIPGT